METSITKQEFVLIPLSQGQFAKVSTQDADRVNKYKWSATFDQTTESYYAKTKVNGTNTNMNRYIMNTPDGMMSDHINHDTLDNTRENLRNVTKSQSAINQRPRGGTSRFKGVNYKDGKWRVRLQIDSKRHHLGCYDDEEEAAIIYNTAAQMFYGEHAFLNQL